jgi:murein DD-endopeptidase MepM/ murein hydrolase activator NlpD
MIGTQLAALMVVLSAVNVPTSAFGFATFNAEGIASDIKVELTTNKTAITPLPDTFGLSQGYNVFHAGIDLRGPVGSKIYAVANGTVKSVSISQYGYGRSVIVEHDNGIESLYAHMGKVYVDEGDKVITTTALGEVGMTGRTTGPHLHLEIRKDGKHINPLTFLNAK